MKGKSEQEEARERLLKVLKPGDTVHTILRHVSRSGMQREISIITRGFLDLDYDASRLLGLRIGKRGGLIVGGCGMDMGFHLIYELANMLWPNGFECIGRNCPANDHTNYAEDDVPQFHKSGGYALRQIWL